MYGALLKKGLTFCLIEVTWKQKYFIHILFSKLLGGGVESMAITEAFGGRVLLWLQTKMICYAFSDQNDMFL